MIAYGSFTIKFKLISTLSEDSDPDHDPTMEWNLFWNGYDEFDSPHNVELSTVLMDHY